KAVGAAWAKAAAELPAVPNKKSEAAPITASVHWDLQKDKWFTDGHGVKQGATQAGEFSIATEGKSIIARIHPGGVFSDLISTNDRGVLISPRLKCEGGTLWMRSAGGGGARAKYVVQNYPRTGTVHKAKEFKDEGDAVLGWRSLDLNYWKGDDIFIQCATVSDMPAEAKPDERSWFGITEALITQDKEAPPSVTIGGDPREAVAAWLANSTTDAQAELLGSLLREGKLPNDTKAIPAAAALIARYREIEAVLPQPTRAPGVLESKGHDAALFVRGDHKQPAEIVPRRFLDGIDPTPYKAANSGRLQLAESLTDPKNPLTSRVIVNRLWHHVFGRGIVGTPDNFGRLGEKPTHLELLDALAQSFTASGGSMKNLIRLMVTSQAFQRGSQVPADVATKDPENKLLSHWTVRRLEAEAIHDSILALSGKLDPVMYGKPVFDDDPRRSIYQGVIRNRADPFLSAFDMPVPFSTRGRRDVTNVPAQSLALLNNPIISNWAAGWARQIVKQEKDDGARVRRMFMQALGRDADDREVAASLAFVKASAGVGVTQRQELATLESQSADLRKRVDDLLTPARAKLTAELPVKATGDAPKPYAEWDFEKDGSDSQGHLPLKLEGRAKIEGGALVLDGKTGVARSAPLKKNLSNKTLEAWVMLDTLDQRGGGVVTVQDRRGVVFDSIVFAESDANQWLAGSDNHKRTQSFSGPQDKEAASRPVHVAIVYDGPKVIGFRDGQMYGRLYKTKETASFKAGDSEVLLGCRHGSVGGNHSLSGRILRARLYDRALSVLEIEASRQVESTVITERDVLNTLSDAQRTDVRQWQNDLQQVDLKITEMGKRLERLSPESAGWESLALSMINLKEFVYLK
ncbi:MAG: DUF1553 domain-containing protein, partial [Prosthecobacter sp.]|nr:DUF1553 domain-containing protein [Prosthecobacter sp.]